MRTAAPRARCLTASRHHSPVYGNLDATVRKRNVSLFRARRTSVLIVTDIAARGIDIPLLDNVINYDFPAKAKLFVHRVGRVARAGRTGVAYSLVANDEMGYVLDLCLFLGRRIEGLHIDELEHDEKKDGVQPADGGADSDDDEDAKKERAAKAKAAKAAEAAAKKADAEAAAAGGQRSDNFGSFPSSVLDNESELVNALLRNDDIQRLRDVSERAFKMYLKTRSGASASSVRRAKALPPPSVHPIFVQRGMVTEDDNQLQKYLHAITHFKAPQTIFEVMEVSGAAMRQKREAHDRLIARQLNKEQSQAARAAGEQHAAEDEPEHKAKAPAAAAPAASGAAPATRVARPSPSRKRKVPKSYRDEAHFIVGEPSVRETATQQAYTIRDGNTLQDVALDVAPDDVEGLNQKRIVKKWDQRRRRYVGVEVGNPLTDLGIKKMRTESGTLVRAGASKAKAGEIYENWKRKHHKSVGGGGEGGDGGDGSGDDDNDDAGEAKGARRGGSRGRSASVGRGGRGGRGGSRGRGGGDDDAGGDGDDEGAGRGRSSSRGRGGRGGRGAFRGDSKPGSKRPPRDELKSTEQLWKERKQKTREREAKRRGRGGGRGGRGGGRGGGRRGRGH